MWKAVNRATLEGKQQAPYLVHVNKGGKVNGGEDVIPCYSIPQSHEHRKIGVGFVFLVGVGEGKGEITEVKGGFRDGNY